MPFDKFVKTFIKLVPMPKFFKFSKEIFTDAFKKKFPKGTKIRVT